MPGKYNPSEIEAKWQKHWEKEKLFQADNHSTKPKFYGLVEFPYPSAEGLHVGHPRSYTALDIIARKRRMEGFNVLYPIGWDAFGLPAENYAIKTGTHPRIKTEENIKNFTRQLKAIGFSFDWSREINTTDPVYYKWTQWIFLQFFKYGLAYKSEMPINFCTSCKVGLANEEVVNGKCERCGGEVIKKIKKQWMLKITKYADRLEKDLDDIDFLEKIKLQQKNWIGKSEGAEVIFSIKDSEEKLNVYTTRPDTLFGVTYMVVSPEHVLLTILKDRISNWSEVKNYINEAAKKSDLERTELNKEKTGVELVGIKAINPVNGKEIPIWVSDYVLASYGTGAIMAVPAHDQRDFDFAKKFNLEIIQVISKDVDNFKSYLMGAEQITDENLKNIGIRIIEKFDDGDRTLLIPENKIFDYEKLIEEKLSPGFWNEYIGKKIIFIFKFKDNTVKKLELNLDTCEEIDKLASEFIEERWNKKNVWNWLSENKFYTDYIVHEEINSGRMINSDFLNGLLPAEAIKMTIKWLEEKNLGKKSFNFKLRDWVFSRQRYWGEPIPLVYCEKCAQKKQKVLLIHGFESNGEGNWFLWLKSELEKQGFEVYNPTMSDSDHPDLKKWVTELLGYIKKMSEDDIVIGHSLGTKAALHLIEKAKRKIGHLFLFAPVFSVDLEDKETELIKARWQNSDLDALLKFANQKFDFKKIDNLIRTKTAIFSDDDLFVKADTNIVPAGWLRQVWHGYGHFLKEKYPAILDLILQAKNTGWVEMEENKLPLELPIVKEFQAGEEGESPLAKLDKWLNTKCPRCGSKAKRESDTMPQWAGSSWYFLRYIDPKNKKEFAAPELLKQWLPIDWYNGGMEHTTLHLLYSRFWHKFLFDLGLVPTKEPYAKRTSQGMVLGEGGEKMSKSRGNVVNPDDVVKEHGADTLRVYEMFMGPFDQAIPWDTQGVVGVKRFLDRVWNFTEDAIEKDSFISEETPEIEALLHKTIKKVGEDIEAMRFNTAISALMVLSNKLAQAEAITKKALELFLQLLSPFAPHITEELWQKLGHHQSIIIESWPAYDESKLKSETVSLVVQVNGKVRATIVLPQDITEDEAKMAALESANVKKHLEGKEVKKVVFVAGKLISFVVN